MNEDAVAELIKQAVDATSVSGEPNYGLLAAITLMFFGAMAALTKFMGSQIIKNMEESAERREGLLVKIDKDNTTNSVTLGRHDERLTTAEKNITKLWDEKAPKEA